MKPLIAKFFGQIANIDENMGKLLSCLEETDLAGNTILLYMTDNGTVAGYEIFNAGMRGHKTEPYEGGHRVPFFIRWPGGGLGKPRDINELTQCQDILPTLIDLCNITRPDSADFDGISLVPILKGKAEHLEDRILVVEYENPYRPDENRAVLWKRWRLVKDTELYDLSADPGQTTNIASKYPEIAEKLKHYYDEWKVKALSGYQEKRYIHIGTEKANPVMLYSSDWSGSYADNMGNLLAGNHTGSWDIKVEATGKYEITLSRWHPASGLELDAPMLFNNKLRGAVPISMARVKIGNYDNTVITAPGQKEVKFQVDIPQGFDKLETWFMDEKNKEICSAYYTNVELIK